MVGERINSYRIAVHVPPCSLTADNAASFAYRHTHNDALMASARRRYPSSNSNDVVWELHSPDSSDVDNGSGSGNTAVVSRDHFRMFEFKVRMCGRAKPHDWMDCPFAHPGEKARRRDPRRFGYSGATCPDFRRGSCRRGDACEFAHGVFESWLHPVRYRTQACKDGANCRRRVCFFAHSPDELRVSIHQTNGLPHRIAAIVECPEMTPVPGGSSVVVRKMVASMQRLQLNEVKSMAAAGIGRGEWEEDQDSERELRARIFEKLSLENALKRVHLMQPRMWDGFQRW